MKKMLLGLMSFLVLTGCTMGKTGTTPTKQVEEYLGNYQTLHSNVIEKIDDIVDKELTFNDVQKQSYKDLIKTHFQNLTYIIKEETINGDKATVEAEVEVTDYSKILKEAESYKTSNEAEFQTDGAYDETLYNDYKLNRIKEATEKVKYTIYFTLTKDGENNWVMDPLTDTEEEKLLGIYEY